MLFDDERETIFELKRAKEELDRQINPGKPTTDILNLEREEMENQITQKEKKLKRGKHFKNQMKKKENSDFQKESNNMKTQTFYIINSY